MAQFQIPMVGRAVVGNLGIGQTLFIVGPNGVGKSSLLHAVARGMGAAPNVEIFSGHRQIHFQNDDTEQTGISISALQTQLFQHSQNANRFRGAWNEQHLKSVVRRITNKQNQDNDDLNTKSIETGRSIKALEEESPRIIRVINRIFAQADLAVEMFLKDGVLRARRGGVDYGIDRLSDGERAALLIVGAILVRPPNGVVAIDEPEKHLNPTISGPLIASTTRARSDLHYVFSSHDLQLLEALRPAVVIYVRNSTVIGTTEAGENRAYDVEVIPNNNQVPEDIKRRVLGVRKPVLFVEGELKSIDSVLYKLIYPDRTIVSRGSWESVCAAVKALRASGQYHWVNPVGLVDRDGRNFDEIAKFAGEMVYVLPVPTIENLFFHPTVVRQMARSISMFRGGATPQDRLMAATKVANDVLEAEHPLILARKVAWAANRSLSEKKVSVKDVMEGASRIKGFDLAPIRASVSDDLKIITSSRPFRELWRQPIKNTALPHAISKALGFNGFDEYQAAVIAAMEGQQQLGRRIIRSLRAALPKL